jgi:hypothetical protein
MPLKNQPETTHTISLEAYDKTRAALDEARRRMCDFIVAAERGGAYLSEPKLRLDAYCEGLEALQVAEDALMDVREDDEKSEAAE